MVSDLKSLVFEDYKVLRMGSDRQVKKNKLPVTQQFQTLTIKICDSKNPVKNNYKTN